jgi:hypothetical protein
MRQLIAATRSVTSRTLLTAVAGLVVVAAIALAPTAASAAPARGAASITSIASGGAATPAPSETATGFTTLAKPSAPIAAGQATRFAGGVSTQAVFSCSYFAYVPVYVIDFTCTVTSGAIALYVDCNGVRYYSAPMPAVGTYYTRANCYPYLITNFGAISLA